MKKKEFAENLKILRAENKMSQADLAKRLGVTQQCVSEWELNNTEPTLTYLCMMADVFEISLDALCGRVEL